MNVSYSQIKRIIETKLNKIDYLYIICKIFEIDINRYEKDYRLINKAIENTKEILSEKNEGNYNIRIGISIDLFSELLPDFNIMDYRIFFMCFLSFKPLLSLNNTVLQRYLHIKNIEKKELEQSLEKVRMIVNFNYSYKNKKLNIIFIGRFTSKDMSFYDKDRLFSELYNNIEKYEKKIIKILKNNKSNIAYMFYSKNNNIKELLKNKFFLDLIFVNRSLLSGR